MLRLDKNNEYNKLEQRLVVIIYSGEEENEISLKQTQKLLFELYGETLPIRESYEKIIESANRLYREYFSGEQTPNEILRETKIKCKN